MPVHAPGPVCDGMRIGLMGGSFNPAHEGHLYVSKTALRRLDLDYVWWLVSPGNPLKPQAAMAPLQKRLAYARFLAHHPRIRVTDIERSLGTVYTLDTLKALKRRFPGLSFVWLMGSDNLMQFHRWLRWQEIAQQMPMAVVLRPGSVLAPLKAKAMGRLSVLRSNGGLFVLDGQRHPQSATAIREQGEWSAR